MRVNNLAAAVVLSVGLLGTVLVQGAVSHQVAATVDANWRGAYDILVTPTGQDFGGAATGGLVDANFVATGGGDPIPVSVLDEIRALSDVAVAAPIGMVGVLRELHLSPQLWVQDDQGTGVSVLSGGVKLYRITSMLTRETALGEEDVSRSQGIVGLRPLTSEDLVNPDQDDPAGGASVGGFGPQWTELGFQVSLGALPAFASTVVAVDPVAEQQLLQGHGSFLAPLTTMTTRTVGDLGPNAPPPVLSGPRYAAQAAAIQTATMDPAQSATALVPLVVNTTPNGRLGLTVTIEKATSSPKTIPTDTETWKAVAASAQFVEIDSQTRDLSAATVPFSSPDLTVLWPGSSIPAGNDAGLFSSPSTELQPALIGRPAYTAAGPTGSVPPQFTVAPTGPVGPDGLPPDTLDPEFGVDPTVGLVQSYRRLGQASGAGFGAALPVPLGTFTAGDLAMPFNEASYVPLGAYDANTTTLVDSPAQAGSDAAGGSAVLPALSGLDFITGPPGAFTDLAGGAALRGGTTPIDAIRVRVDGIAGYSPEAVAKVDDVAKAIAALGVTATVVAGSSPQPVAVYVPDYHLDKAGSAADLGWVRQDWTTLGAARTVVTARAGLVDWLVGLGVGAAAIAGLCAAVLSGRLRRAEVGVLRTVGWTEFRIRRRLAAAQVIPVLLVLAVAMITVVLARHRSLAALASAGGLLAALIAAVSAVLVASARPTRPPTRRRASTTIASTAGLLWRQARAAPWTTLAKVLGPTVTGIGAAAVLTAIITARRASGSTRLAAAVDSVTLTGTIVLAVVGTTAAILVTVIGARSDQRNRGDQWNTLREIGFRDTRISRIQVVDLVWVTGAAVALTAIPTALALAMGIVSTPALPVAIGAAGTAAVVAGALSIRGIGTTR